MTDISHVLLASASPRRHELLTSLGIVVSVLRSGFDELDDPALAPITLARLNAIGKRNAVRDHAHGQDLLLIAADTVVDVDGVAFGKPRDASEATRMLSLLSGRSHLVHSAVALRLPDGRMIDFLESTLVTFERLDHDEIAAYVASGEPMDKAGAYGIQGRAASLVRKIDGDFYTVMGFPIAAFVRAIRDAGLRLSPTNPTHPLP